MCVNLNIYSTMRAKSNSLEDLTLAQDNGQVRIPQRAGSYEIFPIHGFSQVKLTTSSVHDPGQLIFRAYCAYEPEFVAAR